MFHVKLEIDLSQNVSSRETELELLRNIALKTGTPHSTAKLQIVKDCAVMSATAEFV